MQHQAQVDDAQNDALTENYVQPETIAKEGKTASTNECPINAENSSNVVVTGHRGESISGKLHSMG